MHPKNKLSAYIFCTLNSRRLKCDVNYLFFIFSAKFYCFVWIPFKSNFSIAGIKFISTQDLCKHTHVKYLNIPCIDMFIQTTQYKILFDFDIEWVSTYLWWAPITWPHWYTKGVFSWNSSSYKSRELSIQTARVATRITSYDLFITTCVNPVPTKG